MRDVLSQKSPGGAGGKLKLRPDFRGADRSAQRGGRGICHLSLTSDDVTRTAEADVHFHDIIYRSTDNQRLIELLSNLGEQMYRYRVEYLKHREFHPQISREHKELISYLEVGQKGQAEEKIAVRIDKQAQAVLETIRRNRNPEKTEEIPGDPAILLLNFR